MATDITSSTSSAAKQQLVEERVETNIATRRELGQFFTPPHVADYMASLFELGVNDINLLDAGAGSGALTVALAKRVCSGETKTKSFTVTAYELDSGLVSPLQNNLLTCQHECERVGIQFSAKVINEDFISSVAPMVRDDLFSSTKPYFNAAIVNPPYRKLRSDSEARSLLRSVGIETSNFYAGFVALIIRLLAKEGELVAITPRSFCNGPYFAPFRRELLRVLSLRQLHLFESRSAVFGKDAVLQENIILHGIKGISQPPQLIISTSNGRPNSAVSERRVPFRDVISPDDAEQFIRFGVTPDHAKARDVFNLFSTTLDDLGLSVSTGRVVDFRAQTFLRKDPTANTAPLIYPFHFDGGFVAWPRKDSRKPNAIAIHDKTRDLLVPAGVYVVVKRFSSKEERRRIVACVYDPKRISAKLVGFENHLNYFHSKNKGLSMNLAKGLAAFLNSTIVDLYFRQFSGHTQVNAADLRNMKYPPVGCLKALGARVGENAPAQTMLDSLVQQEIFPNNDFENLSGPQEICHEA